MKKTPFRLTPYQVQFLLVVGFCLSIVGIHSLSALVEKRTKV